MMNLLRSLALISLITAPLRATGGTTAAPAPSPRTATVAAMFTPASKDWSSALRTAIMLPDRSHPFFKTFELTKISPKEAMDRAFLAPLVAHLPQGMTPAAFKKLSDKKKAETLNAAAAAAQAQLKAEAALLNDQATGLLARAQANSANSEELNEMLAAYKRVGFYKDYLEQADVETGAKIGRSLRQAIGRLTEARIGDILNQDEPAIPGAAVIFDKTPAFHDASQDRANLALADYTPIVGLQMLAEHLTEPAKGPKDLGMRHGSAIEIAQIAVNETDQKIQYFAAGQLFLELRRAGEFKKVPAKDKRAHAEAVNKLLESVGADSPYGDVKALAARGLLGSPALGDGVTRAANIAVDAGSKSFMQWVKQAAEPLAAAANKKDQAAIAAAVAAIDQALAAAAQAQAPPEPAEAPGDGAPAEVTGNAQAATQPTAPAAAQRPGLLRRHPVAFIILLTFLAMVISGVLRWRNSIPTPVPVQPPVVEQPVAPPTTPDKPFYTEAEKRAMEKVMRDIGEGRAGQKSTDD